MQSISQDTWAHGWNNNSILGQLKAKINKLSKWKNLSAQAAIELFTMH
jgi:hypothetical protein